VAQEICQRGRVGIELSRDELRVIVDMHLTLSVGTPRPADSKFLLTATCREISM
jgi:hypothetical protein